MLDQTCCYAEQGGQIYDLGYMTKEGDEVSTQDRESPRHSFEYFLLKDTEFSLVDVQVRGGYVLHVGNLEGTVKIGDTLKIYIDEVWYCTLWGSSFFYWCLRGSRGGDS